MIQDKVKLLFITSEFWQAGGERHTYEIHRAFDKNKVDISMLSLRPLHSVADKEDYYYSLHLELGAKIFFLDDVAIKKVPTLKEKILFRIKKQTLPFVHQPLIDFLDSFDCIFVMGEYTFPPIEKRLTQKIKNKCHIFIHNSIAQVPENYARYSKETCYNFVSGFKDEEIKHELREFRTYNHHFFPLTIRVDDYTPAILSEKKEPLRIGIFTRLTPNKPLDVFFFALHLLLDKGIDVNLFVFGSGDPVESGFNRVLETLSLKNKVFFLGHQREMIKAALDYQIDLVWFHSYYGFPGGFASFDICTICLPQIFWNFTPGVVQTSYDVFPAYENLNAFVENSYLILSNANELKILGEKQYKHIREERDINKFIHILESICLEQRSLNEKM